MDHGSPTGEGNEERIIGNGELGVRVGLGIKDDGRRCCDQAAPGRKADGCEPLGGGAEAREQ